MAAETGLKKVRIAAMNPVHDLAVLVAHDEGLFEKEGLDVEILNNPGSGTLSGDREGLEKGVFDRAMWSPYNTGEVDQYRMCEWGVMKRTVEAASSSQRPAKIVALGAAMSKMAIITGPKSRIYEPEQLKNTPVAVSTFNGSHFTTLKMLEGFVRKEEIQTTSGGTMQERLEAVKKGEVAAGNFYEPWISIAQKQGLRVLMESHSTRSEAASEELDGPTLAAMFRAEAVAAEMINADTKKYAHYFIEEVQGLLEPGEFQDWRLLYGPPVPYTRERFDDTYAWMLGYQGLIESGSTYEQVVDNRAWE
ncbi:MAG: ABC transporter substrate-binding protein [Chloroflexi bacterium]|nr:ABC transporter substrate-binding protein [Chloroflexota bacterium]MCH8894204.1 ABC transporter substrate-binding protein [Chloroflexota bacterium]MCI0800479.1 ABC transporter substrate-binding protein [Chloroflexota bacterium]MCI0830129.1 ABC transporter substrate-binding protein [Chloroflexota bacterium]MCI0847594.1 ABC transporter substrate-binding protein [Chloroflexota bacterium]